jgi:hypothetical protein
MFSPSVALVAFFGSAAATNKRSWAEANYLKIHGEMSSKSMPQAAERQRGDKAATHHAYNSPQPPPPRFD